MLPSPISFSKRRQFRKLGLGNATHSRTKTIDLLLTRSRITNLALGLILLFAAFSFSFNLSYYLSASPEAHGVPSSILSTLPRDRHAHLSHLIIVPGHAIWKGTDAERRLEDDEWILEPYQRGGQRVAAFFSHIETAAELASTNEDALLVFSGGQTRSTSTTTEAESYHRLALAADVFRISNSNMPFSRVTTENYALDSFQNLIFSIARFHEYTGRYPERITVVGYEMKNRRFTELHRTALRWPRERFHYIGIDTVGEASKEAQQGELLNAYLPFSKDTYGCHTTLLEKRRGRNAFSRFHSYYTSSPELRALLDWCPDDYTTLFGGALPW